VRRAQFIFGKLNALPADAHGCDFSRVKPWYLDGQASLVRQTVLLSAYETPEMRALFNKDLRNVGGKVRTEGTYEGELDKVRRGVRQVRRAEPSPTTRRLPEVPGPSVTRADAFSDLRYGLQTFTRFEASSPLAEPDVRLAHFTEKLMPTVLKSASMRERTLVVVPSYFDFVRVQAWFRQQGSISFASISECVRSLEARCSSREA
jgi:U3 small nucleolar RNA-associated protein 25